MRAGTRDQKTARRPRTGFRFRPPEVEVDAETDWLFLRAFGPPDAEPFVASQELNRERILDLGSTTLGDLASLVHNWQPLPAVPQQQSRRHPVESRFG